MMDIKQMEIEWKMGTVQLDKANGAHAKARIQ